MRKLMNFGWIPVTERLPEDLEEVIVTWVNTNPKPYNREIKGIPFSGVAVFYKSNWYRCSRDTKYVLLGCGEYKDMLIDDAIEITAWRPFPEPYKEESEDE